MSHLIKSNVLRSPATGYTAITGAAPQTVNGSTIRTMSPEGHGGTCVAPGALAAEVVTRLTTSTLTITGKWQVSRNGSTWVDAATPNNAANVVIATGTGSLVETTKSIGAPEPCYGYLFSRFVLTSGVAVGGGAGVDEVSIAYNYRVTEAR